MTLLAPHPVDAPVAPPAPPRTSWLLLAGAASLAAGAVHAAAAGSHGGHGAAVAAFTALAVAQLVWGCVALVRRELLVGVAGAVIGVSAVAGWAMAKTVGLPISGLDEVEPIGTADGLAAGLGTVSFLLALMAMGGYEGLRRRVPVWGAVVLLAGSAAVGTSAAASHVHGDGHADGHGAHAVAKPYDPALPIDLGGTPGVTPQQQAEAEALVVLTLARLPQWSDPAVAERAGFRSIGDGFSGVEHFVNQRFMTDDVILDPDKPESLVYDTTGGGRTLVAAMYMVKPGTPLADVPKVGGALVQWHVHDNLCYSPEGKVRGVTDANGQCPPGLVKPVETPMVHVWITKHRCGPFAALEGIAGGRINEGEARLCDHAHGAAA